VVFFIIGRPLLDRLGPAGAAALAAAAGMVRWSVEAQTAWLPAMAAIRQGGELIDRIAASGQSASSSSSRRSDIRGCHSPSTGR
jgi:hypothetical protein